MTAHLMVTQGPHSGQRFPLNKESITLGRAPDNDVVVNHPQVSRRHAHITRRDKWLVLEDLGSTNGTFVGKRRLTGPHTLEPGNVIGLGTAVKLTFQEESPTSPAQPKQRADSDTLRMNVDQAPPRFPPPPPRPSEPPSSWQPKKTPPPDRPAPAPPPGLRSTPPPSQSLTEATEDGTERKTWLWIGWGCLALAFVCFAVGLFLWFAPEGFWLALQDFGLPIPPNPF